MPSMAVGKSQGERPEVSGERAGVGGVRTLPGRPEARRLRPVASAGERACAATQFQRGWVPIRCMIRPAALKLGSERPRGKSVWQTVFWLLLFPFVRQRAVC
jgi:hypothetical protein